MSASAPAEITVLLRRWEDGDERALDRLMPLVYDELLALAHRRLAGERTGHTLQTTDLVHEAYGRLAEVDLPLQDRAHFFALAARAMRRILVDHARARMAGKRGGGRVPVSLDELAVEPPADDGAEVLALHEALEALEKQDPRKARVVEAHIFGGLTYDETAIALGISPATVDRDLRLAKAWLARELG
jgi:RNA polymerase sigma factor (TIGR02999 family)